MKSLFFLSTIAVSFISATSFTVNVNYPTTSSLYLRGSACGLNWSKGVKLSQVSSTKYQAKVNCQPSEAKLEVKVLVNDNQWMIGANHIADTSKT